MRVADWNDTYANGRGERCLRGRLEYAAERRPRSFELGRETRRLELVGEHEFIRMEREA